MKNMSVKKIVAMIVGAVAVLAVAAVAAVRQHRYVIE